jgi:hypothetical protein
VVGPHQPNEMTHHHRLDVAITSGWLTGKLVLDKARIMRYKVSAYMAPFSAI